MRQWKHDAAIKFGIDDDAVARLYVGVSAGFHHFADHLVAHDPRIAHGNRAAVDFVVGAADPAIRHADQHLPLADCRARHLAQRQFVRRAQNHCLHGFFSGPLSPSNTESA